MVFICEDDLAEQSIISLCFSQSLFLWHSKIQNKKNKKSHELFDEGDANFWVSLQKYVIELLFYYQPNLILPLWQTCNAKCDTNVQYVQNTHLQLIKATSNLILQRPLS